MKFTLFFCFLLISFNAKSEQSITTVSYPPPLVSADVRNQYFIEIMKLALEKTVSTHGAYQLKPAPVKMQQSRALSELSHDRVIDIVWSMTSIEREKLLSPVRIPLLKGTLGFRVALIRKEDQKRFSEISTLKQLKKLHAGQGHDWPDTKILQHNGIAVVTSPLYSSLFTMLENNRFDYFPRGIAEAWIETDHLTSDLITIEQSLLIHYPSPIYFFTSKNNHQLAKRITDGLWLAIKDGSFDEVFFDHLNQNGRVTKQNIKDRKLISLTNPLLPTETPVNDKRLWLDWVEFNPPNNQQ